MDPRLSRTNSNPNEKPPSPCSRGDPRLRTTQQNQPQHHWPHPMAQLPQTHYTIGDGLTTYQHLVPNAAATASAIYPPYAQYTGYAAAYQPSAYGHHPAAYAAYYAPAPPPQHMEQYAQQQPVQVASQPAAASQAQTYAPQGARQGSWAPARMSEQMPVQAQVPITAYLQQQQQATITGTTMLPPSPDVTAISKQEGVEQEKHQSQADMRRQRDDFEIRAAALSRELDQLKRQKRELKRQLIDGGSADRQTANVLKDNAKLQAEIQIKLKEFASMSDILTGILRDRKKSHRSSSKRHRSLERNSSDHRSRNRDKSSRDKSTDSTSSNSSHQSDSNTANSLPQHQQSQLPDLAATVQYNYVHYDPEIHWCRICDAFPRTAKDLLQHLHDDEHRQLMQAENIEIPWHKLPSQDAEFPFREGATKRRVPIKGLQFFVSAPAWYCRLCDHWIGDLHCASQHLKSVGHSQNYANFVEQNPQWEDEWLEDRKKALDRVSKNLIEEKVDSTLDLDGIENKAKTLTSISSAHAMNKKCDKKSKKSKSSKKNKSATKKGKKLQSKKLSDDSSNDSTSSTTSSSDDYSSSDDDENNDVDKTKSIRVAMRNQVMKSNSTTMDEQILILENLVKEKKRLQQQELDMQSGLQSKSHTLENQLTTPLNNIQEDRLISQWMNIDSTGQNVNLTTASTTDEKNKDKYLLDSLKDRLKQKQDREQKARQLLQLQQQRVLQEQEDQEERVRLERGRQEREELEEKEHRAREGIGLMCASREQVKFRQFRGGIAASSAQRRRSNDVSPTTGTSPPTKSRLNRSSRRSRSRSRSNSSTERRGIRDNRDRRDRDRKDYSASKIYQRGSSRGRRNSSRSRSRSNSKARNTNSNINAKTDPTLSNEKEKKQQQTVAQRKLPFIGRMPLFKNRKLTDDKTTSHQGKATTIDAGEADANKAISDSYEMPRQSRFQPGNLARAFIPQPDVVHYPRLTTQPAPLPAPPVLPEAPRISVPQPPPPPKIQPIVAAAIEPAVEAACPEVYEYTEAEFEQVQSIEEPPLVPPLPLSIMPPLPPKYLHFPMESTCEEADDLAMLGISSDDMAAQVF